MRRGAPRPPVAVSISVCLLGFRAGLGAPRDASVCGRGGRLPFRCPCACVRACGPLPSVQTSVAVGAVGCARALARSRFVGCCGFSRDGGAERGVNGAERRRERRRGALVGLGSDPCVPIGAPQGHDGRCPRPAMRPRVAADAVGVARAVRTGRRVSGVGLVWACWIPARAATASHAGPFSGWLGPVLGSAAVGFLCCVPVATAVGWLNVSRFRRSPRPPGPRRGADPEAFAALHSPRSRAAVWGAAAVRSLGCRTPGGYGGQMAPPLLPLKNERLVRFVRTTAIPVLVGPRGPDHAAVASRRGMLPG